MVEICFGGGEEKDASKDSGERLESEEGAVVGTRTKINVSDGEVI